MANAISARFRGLLAAICLTASAASNGVGAQPQDLDEQARTVRTLLDRGRYSDAEAEAERLFLALGDGAPGTLHTRAGDLLVESLTHNGHAAESRTRQLAERMVAAHVTLGSVAMSRAASVRNLGAVFFATGEYAVAIAHFRDALALDEQREPADPIAIAEDLAHLAQALTETEQYDEALALCNRGLAVSEQAAANGSIARLLQIRGLLRQRRGDYPNARADFERALKLREAADPTHPETAIALTLSGAQLRIDGDLLRSRETLTRAVALARTVLRPDHPDIAFSLRVLAATLQELGDLSGSRELRERTAEIVEKTFGPNHTIVAVHLNDLANTLLLQGEYSKARPLYERALGIYERRFGADSVGVTTAVYNLALLHSQLGDRQEARRYYERAIAAWTRVLGPGHSTVARALSAYATFLARQGLDVEAQPYYERALTIREREFGPDHLVVAQTLSRLAASLARLGQRRRAIELSARAVRISERSGARESLADNLVMQAQILGDAGDAPGAARSYEQALQIRLPLLGPSHPEVANTEVAFAVTQARLHNYDDAFARALRGDEITRNHSRLTLGFLSERQALDYAASRPRGLDLALSLISNADENRQVLNSVILGRSLTLDEIGSRRRLLLHQTSDAFAPLWTDLASARQRLANLVIRGPGAQKPEQYAALVDEARREKEQAERALAERSATFRSERARAEIGLEQVRSALPRDAALVSFIRFNRTVRATTPSSDTTATQSAGTAPPAITSYMALVLRAGRVDPDAVFLGGADAIDTLIADWRTGIAAGAGAPARNSAQIERAFRVTGANLRRKLWDPITSHLEGVSRVFIVPDDAINLVTFAALPVEQSRYLLEVGPVIHYLSAERDLVETEGRSDSAGRGLLAVGGPAFADGSLFASNSKSKGAQVETPAVATVASSALRGSSAKCATFQSMQFPPLPGSGREAQEVAELWRSFGLADAANGSAVIGREASEHAVKQLSPGRRILHLATHGFFLGDECSSPLEGTRAVGGLATSSGPKASTARARRSQVLPENPLVMSGLALAGANRRASAGPEEDDGILTAEEVASLNLEGVEWAVLSACDTALGQLRAGEGVFGLRRAFQVAGARTIIMSLWPVEDQSARLWMRALYEGRLQRRLDTADAVHQAALTVLQERRRQGRSTHPFYWAGFVAAGDWR